MKKINYNPVFVKALIEEFLKLQKLIIKIKQATSKEEVDKLIDNHCK